MSNSRDNISDSDKLKYQMEILSFSIAHTATAINKQTVTVLPMLICSADYISLFIFIMFPLNAIYDYN